MNAEQLVTIDKVAGSTPARDATPSAPQPSAPWITRLKRWLEVKRLEREIRSSRDFQKICQHYKCPNLVQIEQQHCTILEEKLRALRNR